MWTQQLVAAANSSSGSNSYKHKLAAQPQLHNIARWITDQTQPCVYTHPAVSTVCLDSVAHTHGHSNSHPTRSPAHHLTDGAAAAMLAP